MRAEKHILLLGITALLISGCGKESIMIESPFSQSIGIDDGFVVLEDGSIIGSHWSADEINRVYPDGRTKIIAQFPKPNGVAWDPVRKQIFVLSSSSPRMLTYRPETGELEVVPMDRIYSGIHIPKGGTIYLSSWGNNLVATYEAASNKATVLFSGSPLNGPQGICVDSHGSLLVGNFNDGKVFRLSGLENDPTLEEVFQVPGKTEFRIGDIHWYRGRLLISALEQKQIWILDVDSLQYRTIGRGAGANQGSQDGNWEREVLDTPNSFFVLGNRVFFSDFEEKRIRVISIDPDSDSFFH